MTMWMTWHSCHIVSTIHVLLLSLSMCAMGVVGGQSWLLAVVAIGEMLGMVGMVGINGGGWERRIVDCLLIVDDNKSSVGFADACFGCSKEITTVIELTLLLSNGWIDSILDVATILCNQIRLFLWGLQQNFHGIHVEPMWNP